MLAPVVLLLALLRALSAQVIPAPCASQQIRASGVCCPSYMGSPCGRDLGRGDCRALPSDGMEGVDRTQYDGRYYKQFSSVCVCNPNFDGFDCGMCQSGWNGTNCENRIDLVRPEIREMSPDEWKMMLARLHYFQKKQCQEYVILVATNRADQATYSIRQVSYMGTWTYQNYYLAMPLYYNLVYYEDYNFMYYSAGHLPARRASLLFFEQLMRLCTKDPSFVVPYFDPTTSTNCAACNNNLLGANNALGQLDLSCIFSSWRGVCATAGTNSQLCPMSNTACERPQVTRVSGAAAGTRMPTRDDVNQCLNFPNYDRSPFNASSTACFRNCMEGHIDTKTGTTQAVTMSRMMHLYFGGTMGNYLTCANDPIHIFLICFWDKIYDIWINRYSATPGTFPQGVPFHQGGGRMIPAVWPPRNYSSMMVSSRNVFGVSWTVFEGL